MIRRCSCMLLAEIRTLRPHQEVVAVATAVHAHESSRSLKELINITNSMLSDGSRYNNLEKVLGVGAALALGKNYSETL